MKRNNVTIEVTVKVTEDNGYPVKTLAEYGIRKSGTSENIRETIKAMRLEADMVADMAEEELKLVERADIVADIAAEDAKREGGE